MVKRIYLEKATSKKSGNDYLSLVFDCGWTKVRVFLDHMGLCSLFDLKVEELSCLKNGDRIDLPYVVDDKPDLSF